MHSKDLSQEQAAALTAGVLRCLRFLGRLRERCDKKMSKGDPLYQAVYAAYDAVFTRRMMLSSPCASRSTTWNAMRARRCD